MVVASKQLTPAVPSHAKPEEEKVLDAGTAEQQRTLRKVVPDREVVLSSIWCEIYEYEDISETSVKGLLDYQYCAILLHNNKTAQ